MNSQKNSIEYIIEDQTTKQTERFDMSLGMGFRFKAQNQFTGEWWNRSGNIPYPIRYYVEISQLMYGLSDNPSGPESFRTIQCFSAQ